MKTISRILAVTSAVLLLGAAIMPAQALDISVGTGGANATNGPQGSSGSLGITNDNGPLVALSQEGNTADGTVNLGGAGIDGLDFGGIDGGGLLPGGGAGATGGSFTQVASAFSSLSADDQQLLKNRCRTILVNPAAFDASTVQLCRIIARVGQAAAE